MRTTRVRLDCSRFGGQGLGTVDEIARLRLEATRRGWDVRLVNPGAPLLDLIALVGLGEILRVESGRQPEQREEPRRVEEEGELGDPSA